MIGLFLYFEEFKYCELILISCEIKEENVLTTNSAGFVRSWKVSVYLTDWAISGRFTETLWLLLKYFGSWIVSIIIYSIIINSANFFPFFLYSVHRVSTNTSNNAMANNTMESTRNNMSDEKLISNATFDCIPWLFLLIIECLAIVIFNAVSACVLVKMRQQQRRGTCLIIHLAIVDLSVGAVAGHVFIQGLGASCNLWENVLWSEKYSWVNYLILTLRQLFLYLSVINLAFISSERAYATFFPFKYRGVKKWVYGVIIIVTWFMPLTLALVGDHVHRKGSYVEFLSFRLFFWSSPFTNFCSLHLNFCESPFRLPSAKSQWSSCEGTKINEYVIYGDSRIHACVASNGNWTKHKR